MWEAKKAGEYTAKFAGIRFVYLHKPKELLVHHLAGRPAKARDYTLKCYDRYTIECAEGKNISTIAAEIATLATKIQTR